MGPILKKTWMFFVSFFFLFILSFYFAGISEVFEFACKKLGLGFAAGFAVGCVAYEWYYIHIGAIKPGINDKRHLNFPDEYK